LSYHHGHSMRVMTSSTTLDSGQAATRRPILSVRSSRFLSTIKQASMNDFYNPENGRTAKIRPQNVSSNHILAIDFFA